MPDRSLSFKPTGTRLNRPSMRDQRRITKSMTVNACHQTINLAEEMQAFRKWVSNTQQPPEHCVFCRMAADPDTPSHYRDHELFVIDDISKGSAQEHLLVITKHHFPSALEVDPALLRRMQAAGEAQLRAVCERKGLQPSFRLGFHLRPFNSVDHVHLHCFLQPLTDWRHNWISYWLLLTPVEQAIAKQRP